MRGKPTDRETVASALVMAAVAGDVRAAAHWNMGASTLGLWRRRMATDETLARLVDKKRAEARERIGDRLDEAIMSAVAYLHGSLVALPVGDPGSMHIAAGVLKMLTEAKIGVAVIGARAAGEARSAHAAA